MGAMVSTWVSGQETKRLWWAIVYAARLWLAGKENKRKLCRCDVGNVCVMSERDELGQPNEAGSQDMYMYYP